MMRRVKRGSISLELLLCGGGMYSILLLHIVARCLDTIHVFIWCSLFYVWCSDCVTLAPIAQLVSALDLETSSVQVEGSILTAGKRLSLKNLNVIIRAIN